MDHDSRLAHNKDTVGGERPTGTTDVSGCWDDVLFAATLVDEGDAKPAELDFVLHQTEKAQHDYVSTSGSAINIQHILGEKDGRVESCWLGDTNWGKDKKEGRSLAGSREVSVDSFQVAFSAVRGEEDALRIVAAPADEHLDVERARDILRCARAYAKRIANGTAEITDKHTAEAEEMLAACMNMTTILHRERTGGDGGNMSFSKVSGLSSFGNSNLGGFGGGSEPLRGDALLAASGPPRKTQQKVCADMKVMNGESASLYRNEPPEPIPNSNLSNPKGLFKIPQMWVNMAPVKLWNNAHFIQLGKLRGSTMRVHKLCFHALSLMFQGNHDVQMYCAKQQLLVPYKWTPKHYARLEQLASRDIKEVTADMLDKHGRSINSVNYTHGTERVFSSSSTISMLIRQINAGKFVGATECLRKLLSDNFELLRSHVNEGTVKKFLELIADKGPKAQVPPLSSHSQSQNLILDPIPKSHSRVWAWGAIVDFTTYSACPCPPSSIYSGLLQPTNSRPFTLLRTYKHLYLRQHC